MPRKSKFHLEDIAHAIDQYWRVYTMPPSIRDICRMTGIKSTNHCHMLAGRLPEDDYFVVKGKYIPRWVKERIKAE